MSTTTAPLNLERIEQLIGRSTMTMAFLQVQRLEELIRLAKLSGASMVDGYPIEYSQIALNVQTDHYRNSCVKHGTIPHI